MQPPKTNQNKLIKTQDNCSAVKKITWSQLDFYRTCIKSVRITLVLNIILKRQGNVTKNLLCTNLLFDKRERYRHFRVFFFFFLQKSNLFENFKSNLYMKFPCYVTCRFFQCFFFLLHYNNNSKIDDWINQ